MQHQFGKPLHRSTEWRRNKNGGNGRKGRRWASDYEDEGFLGFVATVISLINKNGSVGYGELENRNGDGNRSYRKDETTDEIFGSLANSGFPPAMLAVAACMIGKLNKKTRRGAKPINPMPHEKAFIRLKESGKEITVENWQKDLRRAKIEIVLKQLQIVRAQRERILADAERSDFNDKWAIEYLKQYKTPPDRRAESSSPTALSNKATPPQSIDFIHGAKLTRQNASYWRKHPRFADCLRFFKTVLKRDEIPKVPSDDGWQMPYDYYVNGEIQMYWRIRQLEKLTAAKNQTGIISVCLACCGGWIRCPDCHQEVGKKEKMVCPTCRDKGLVECYNTTHLNREKKIEPVMHVVTDKKTGKPVNCKVCKNRRIITCPVCKGKGHL